MAFRSSHFVSRPASYKPSRLLQWRTGEDLDREKSFWNVDIKRNWLLIVFLILAAGLLYAIFAPVGYPIHAAMRSACLSNLKQLALAQQMYASDHDGRFPFRDNWMDATEKYRKNDDILRCSKLRKDKAPQNLYGYAMNQAMSGSKEPKDPDTVPLVFDSINLARNASGTLESLPNPPRHGKVDNIGYADGHAKGIVLNQP